VSRAARQGIGSSNVTAQRQLHTVVVGLGATGFSCLSHLSGRERVTVVDTRPAPARLGEARQRFPDADIRVGVTDPAALLDADRVVVSPGVPLDHPLLRLARERGIPFTSDIGLFCEEVRAPVIGITGTNGKSTVTVLAGALLEGAGFDVAVGGNLGEPALDLLQRDAEMYVLELSSFQLERLNGEAIEIGTVLNLSPDHMDRYVSLADYARAKQRIYRGARVAVYNRADPWTRPPAEVPIQTSVGLDAPAPGQWGIARVHGVESLCRSDEVVLPVLELGLQGRHNQFNALAAAALAGAAGADVRRFEPVLTGFGGLDHRTQLVGRHRGVRFINDSKATNVGATVAALDGLGDATRRHVLLIAGGDAKGADLRLLREPVARYVGRVYLLGKDADALEAAITDLVPVTRVQSLEDAVVAAAADARDGDIVLLSPACASLDMFSGFDARGRAFAAAVAAVTGS
jgi:UDP-N-acetylmuramoylalanine--D-glutamate ligase